MGLSKGRAGGMGVGAVVKKTFTNLKLARNLGPCEPSPFNIPLTHYTPPSIMSGRGYFKFKKPLLWHVAGYKMPAARPEFCPATCH